ncbi:MAG: hypothetical protein CM15mP122_5750 [Bacteroidota bacterium]|nr:MAG: hypothetical protein CM15mP122_5750 [Bacteroidota bacterium]
MIAYFFHSVQGYRKFWEAIQVMEVQMDLLFIQALNLFGIFWKVNTSEFGVIMDSKRNFF